eukprot:CAMPEP_0168477408 /NCGR_PEP_ID=MMETSP0228-20121227/62400_1 /TAXON_ID=133427 /ORGANISM="Protoceratium reticulatum, Strain CCCM 535 (=CCMP 1889)" /LENGTH=54 /DNA_ID=CAMNT_0008493583 /DNA_START=54 /DNA_END=215 /DNA_ORIENTATION=+
MPVRRSGGAGWITHCSLPSFLVTSLSCSHSMPQMHHSASTKVMPSAKHAMKMTQ